MKKLSQIQWSKQNRINNNFKNRKMEKNIPTVFTNTELGKSLQRMWLIENQSVLSKNFVEQKADFVLVVPSGTNANARFMNLDDMPKCEIKERISNYILQKKGDDNVIVIFMNPEGRVSYYAIRSDEKLT